MKHDVRAEELAQNPPVMCKITYVKFAKNTAFEVQSVPAKDVQIISTDNTLYVACTAGLH